jgi:hypothetical protein
MSPSGIWEQHTPAPRALYIPRMGVEYLHLLIPRDRRNLPEATTVTRLVDTLAAERYLPQGSHGTRWHIEDDRDAGLRYPFVGELPDYAQRYYTIALVHAQSGDFFYDTSECIDPFDDTRCACGADLAYDPEPDDEHRDLPGTRRLYQRCPACGADVDPSGWTAIVRDGATGDERELRGAPAFRFAVVIDCGKSVPRETGSVRLDPALIAACERALGVPLDDVGDYY